MGITSMIREFHSVLVLFAGYFPVADAGSDSPLDSVPMVPPEALRSIVNSTCDLKKMKSGYLATMAR